MKNAKLAKVEFNRALHLYPAKESDWQPKVLLASALHHQGIDAIYAMIEEYMGLVKNQATFNRKEMIKIIIGC